MLSGEIRAYNKFLLCITGTGFCNTCKNVWTLNSYQMWLIALEALGEEVTCGFLSASLICGRPGLVSLGHWGKCKWSNQIGQTVRLKSFLFPLFMSASGLDDNIFSRKHQALFCWRMSSSKQRSQSFLKFGLLYHAANTLGRQKCSLSSKALSDSKVVCLT